MLALDGTARAWEPKRLRLFSGRRAARARRPPPAAGRHLALGRQVKSQVIAEFESYLCPCVKGRANLMAEYPG